MINSDLMDCYVSCSCRTPNQVFRFRGAVYKSRREALDELAHAIRDCAIVPGSVRVHVVGLENDEATD